MMVKKIIGWVSILLAVFSLAPSLVPGAMSVIGLVIGLASVVLSLFSVGNGRRGYFLATAVIVVLGIILANDAVRIVGSLPHIPIEFKLVVYGVSSVVVFGCFVGANKLYSKEKTHNN